MEVKLNKETISLVVAVFGLAGTTWGFFTWVQSGRAENSPIVRELIVKQVENDHRLDRTDRDRDRFNANIKELSDKTGTLTETMVRLNTTLELQAIERKRAEQMDTPLLPSRSPSAIHPLPPERRK